MEEVDLFAGLPVCGFGWWSDVLTTDVLPYGLWRFDSLWKMFFIL